MHLLIAKIDSSRSITELIKEVNVLSAVNWIAKAVKNVPADTVKKCFRKAGFALDESPLDDVETTLDDDLSHLLRDCHVEVDVDYIITFDDDLSMEAPLAPAVDFIPVNEEANKSDEDEEESNE